MKYKPCYGSGWRHSMFDFCNCEPPCTSHDGQGDCGACNGTGVVADGYDSEGCYTDRENI